MKNDIVAEGVNILRVNEKSVHVEEAGPDVGETVLVLVN